MKPKITIQLLILFFFFISIGLLAQDQQYDIYGGQLDLPIENETGFYQGASRRILDMFRGRDVSKQPKPQ